MEIARALQFFFTSSQYNEIDYIVLAGGSAVLPGLDDAVATRTQVSTMVANPFALMTLSGRIKKPPIASGCAGIDYRLRFGDAEV